MNDRPGGEEEERLEERVVPDVKETARHAEEDPIGPAEGSTQHGQPESHDDDADVLDAVVREQSLEVVLPEGKRDAQDPADDSEKQKNRSPSQRRGRKITEESNQSVDADLQHDSREHRGDMARRVGVGARQPDMKGHQARLEAEADHHENEENGQDPQARFPLDERSP